MRGLFLQVEIGLGLLKQPFLLSLIFFLNSLFFLLEIFFQVRLLIGIALGTPFSAPILEIEHE